MKRFRSASKQKGAVLALFAIGLVAIIALAGFALDLSHAYVDKTKLQNAFDAAALSGAMTLINTGGNTSDATADAEDTFTEVVQGTELAGLTPDVEFSPTLKPFVSGGSPPRFVRVKLRDGDTDKRFNMTTWLVKVIGKDTIKIAGSAVAGPAAADSCNLAPFVVCGDTNLPCYEEPNPNNCYGFDVWNGDVGEEEECYLKGCAPGGGDCDTTQITGKRCGEQEGSAVGGGTTSDVGTGSFYLLALDCTGADCLRDAFKDGVDNCATPGDFIPTEPGVKKGPLEQAYNTKFGDYSGGGVNPDDYPPDRVTVTESSGGGRLYYDEYRTNPPRPFHPKGVESKRVMTVIIADCEEKKEGRDDIKVEAVGCFFGTQPVEGGGNAQVVWGEFIGKDVPGCMGESLSLSPTTVTQKIILYKDEDSGDS